MMGLNMRMKMVRRVVNFVWSDLIQDFVEAPLDDADPWTLALANQVNGRDLSDREFAAVVALFNADVCRGVDI